MDIFEMIEAANLPDSVFGKGQHYCCACIHNTGVADYDEACEAYVDAGGEPSEW